MSIDGCGWRLMVILLCLWWPCMHDMQVRANMPLPEPEPQQEPAPTPPPTFDEARLDVPECDVRCTFCRLGK